jgi:hypothetical protein
MKKIKTLFLSAGILLLNYSGFAQIIPGAVSYHEQALMFSNYNYAGTARIHAIGNTQISLGGDISVALSNPAGLGFYNRSELSITPSFNIFQTDNNYIGNNISSPLNTFNIDNLGVVFNRTKSDYEPGKWRGGSFAISFSKINEFNTEINYQGLNTNNDILDFYVQDANIQNVDPADLVGVTRGAYETYLMSEFLDAFVNGNDTTYFPFYERTFIGEVPNESFPTEQSETISTSGSQNQWNFSYGGNYGDIFYFGVTLGIQSLRYRIIKEYVEQYPGAQGDIVNSSGITEDLLTEGIGINGTFGIIARPINQMTLGLSLITPTYLSISERYLFNSSAGYNGFNMRDYADYFDANYDLIVNEDAAFTTFYEDDANLTNQSYEEESFFDYSISTPLRINGGVTYFFNKNGFVSGDIEYVDYSNMRLSGDGGSLDGDNLEIKELYKSVINYRVGAEWRINKFRVRAGYNYKSNPYNEDLADLSSQTISAGLGFRSSKVAIDLATSTTSYNTFYAPYVLDNPDNSPFFETEMVSIDNNNLNFMLTFGLFF